MLAETMAGIALVKSSVEFIKSNIQTCQDIGDLVGAVDGLFKGKSDIQKEKTNKQNSLLGSTKSAAQEVIDQKLAEEAMEEMRILIDNRFGWGTWQEIITLRAKQIQEQREQEKEIRIAKLRKQQQFKKDMELVAIVGLSLVIGITVLGAAWYFLL